MTSLSFLNRDTELFDTDVNLSKKILINLISKSNILIIGAAGTIGKSTVKEIIKFFPKKIHAVDISENNIVELVRDVRSSSDFTQTDFKTFALDCGSKEFEYFVDKEGPYDYVLNLSALKHVRSEKDQFTLMRMINLNIFNSIKILHLTKPKKYFCVSTDKATNPINMMGASKAIMEKFLFRESLKFKISMARFANVLFSDGSLLHGFNQRFLNQQPFSVPNDIQRYFITQKESGQLCLMSSFLGDNRDIFFPKINNNLKLIKFTDLAILYLELKGYEVYICNSENEAREMCKELISKKKWPCYFFKSDTTGEKTEEEFYTKSEKLNMDKFQNIGIIKNKAVYDDLALKDFENKINFFQKNLSWSRADLIQMFSSILPNFDHYETGKYLDEKM